MRLPFNVLLCLMCFTSLTSAQITVSENNRFLMTNDGKPFFWLGDTDWEMAHRLTRKEAEEVIDTRAQQGFNVLQVVALAEFNGIHEPNRYGDLPLTNDDPTRLLVTAGSDTANADQYDYWDNLDFIIHKAAHRGIYIGLLPTWGDKVTLAWGTGPVVFDSANAETYGKILAQRYAKDWNVIWILGGDRPAIYKPTDRDSVDQRVIWRAMAAGIESVLGKQAFITYHPSGGSYSTSSYIHREPWLDMNAFQSGHGSREAEPWKLVTRDLALIPQKPTIDMEPCYEDHPVNPWDGKWTRARGYFSAYDVRARIYRGIFAGSCGVTYGHHHIWQFMNPEIHPPINTGDTIIPWNKALHAEAAKQMIYLKRLMLSRPYFTRINGQNIIKSEIGSNYKDLVVATIDENKTYAFVYVPEYKPVSIDLDKISGVRKNATLFDPQTGLTVPASVNQAKGVATFFPPNNVKDWVLIIDDASKNYPDPGK